MHRRSLRDHLLPKHMWRGCISNLLTGIRSLRQEGRRQIAVLAVAPQEFTSGLAMLLMVACLRALLLNALRCGS